MARPGDEEWCLVCGRQQFEDCQAGPPADLADRLIAENRFAVAYECVEDLVSRGEETAWGCRVLAWMSFTFRDFRAVETWSHESIRLDGASPEPHLLLAYVLDGSGRWPEAVEEYDIALRREGLSVPRRQLVAELRAGCLARIPEF
jgi:hypothetical protein